MSLTLSPEELLELTGKVRPHAQARVLDALGIAFQTRPDGTLVVYRDNLPVARRAAIRRQPVFDHIRSRA